MPPHPIPSDMGSATHTPERVGTLQTAAQL